MNSQFAAWPLSWQRVLPPASCGSSIGVTECVCECVLFSFYHSVCVFWMRHCLCLWPEQKHSGQTGSEHYEWTNIRMPDRIIDARFFCWPQTRSSGSYSLPHSTRVSHAAALSLFLSLPLSLPLLSVTARKSIDPFIVCWLPLGSSKSMSGTLSNCSISARLQPLSMIWHIWATGQDKQNILRDSATGCLAGARRRPVFYLGCVQFPWLTWG